MAEKFVIPIHGGDHCPGGPDPIPCLGNPIAFRATFSGSLSVGNLSETIILFNTWENEDSSIFGETLFSGSLQKVSLRRAGVYAVTLQIIWNTNFAFRCEALVLDDSGASSASIIYGNMSGHAPVSEGGSQFTYPLTFSATRKWPLLGVTEADVLAGVYGRLMAKALQASGSAKTLSEAGLEIYYFGGTEFSVPLS